MKWRDITLVVLMDPAAPIPYRVLDAVTAAVDPVLGRTASWRTTDDRGVHATVAESGGRARTVATRHNQHNLGPCY